MLSLDPDFAKGFITVLSLLLSNPFLVYRSKNKYPSMNNVTIYDKEANPSKLPNAPFLFVETK
jgi:hypothetical protein